MKVYGVIMAGGEGERFWPLSRRACPKQLLNLSGKEVMVNEAFDRLARVAARDDIYIVTNNNQKKRMREVTARRLSADHILIEPCARNTVACIGYAAMQIKKRFGDGIMVITPSDAYIKDNVKFAETLNIAIDSAERTGQLVTVGIKPTFPATGYGYIRFRPSREAVKKVTRFVEKPNLRRAKKYVAGGDFVWNSGMFIWKASVILERYQKLLPEVYDLLVRIGESIDTEKEAVTLKRVYPQLPSISIDVAILEKSKDILVVPGEFGWNDVGSWDMLSALYGEDPNGNVLACDFEGVDTHGTVAYSKNKLVAAIGLKDMIIVDTPNAILVCPKKRAQEVKKIVESLKKRGKEDLL